MTELAETPSAAVAAQNKVLVTDARGRLIAVHKLNLLQFYNLTRAMGDAASNATLMDMAITAAAVRRIDTTDFPLPNTEADVRVMMKVLDFEGLAAAGEGLRRLHANADAANGVDAAKNLAGNPPSE
jgi:hypothetical protein